MTKYGSSGWSHWDNNYTIIIHLRIKDNHGPVLADVRRDWGYWGPGSVRLLPSCLSAKYPNKWFFFSILIRNQKYPLRMLRVISVPRYNLADWRLSVSVWYIWRWTVSRCQTVECSVVVNGAETSLAAGWTKSCCFIAGSFNMTCIMIFYRSQQLSGTLPGNGETQWSIALYITVLYTLSTLSQPASVGRLESYFGTEMSEAL